ncbi:hypothetical protein HMPREF0762_01626 [Slackia exigua ATCC 700122]|uniref:Uncharacterized protein n=1 Tax=Slackia exigua (strain ATCC 700122 / DSM 15923 / CIP 105133 / JCM 11022 / KCTC 5966 / S-7) TaxID=649764 RepID=D0WIF0_SLAES|nr:hypothetical protein HMPREF0762_01626 [Slackia exigua ATCC 700122]
MHAAFGYARIEPAPCAGRKGARRMACAHPYVRSAASAHFLSVS